MIEPVQSDGAFLADVARRRALPGVHLWWLGQSGFLVCWQNHCALTDPYLSDSLTIKYQDTDKPHVRMTRRVIDPARLDFLHAVASTHNHTDHLDALTLRPLIDVNPELALIVPAANRDFAADRIGVDPLELLTIDAGQTIEVAGFSWTGVPAAHDTVERDALGRCRFLGYVIRAGGCTIYHSGDTLLYDGMIDLLRPMKVNIALLPINGRAPERRVAGNLSGVEAARLAHEIGAGLVVPCHYEMFEFNTASPDDLIAECRRLNQRCRVMRAGEGWTHFEGSSSTPRG